MSKPKIAFIGLGIMGGPMAKNVLDAGYDVIGYNRSQEPIREHVEAGGDGATSAAQAPAWGDPAWGDVTITCLPGFSSRRNRDTPRGRHPRGRRFR